MRAGAAARKSWRKWRRFDLDKAMPILTIRWTIGDVSERGFEALRLSAWGAWRMFGNGARYVVCVNTIALERARELTGEAPGVLKWRDVTNEFPEFLRDYFDSAMAEGVGWKFAPPRISSDGLELSLDNDCIIWKMPGAIRRWVASGRGFVFAEDVRPCFGQFTHLCGERPRNSGIRGLPPGFDLEAAMARILRDQRLTLRSELDEQGLQAAILLPFEPSIVSTREVSICSPFPPHMPNLGECGAHFVGLNAKRLPWAMDGRPAVDHIHDHWKRLRAALHERVGAGQ